MPSKKETTRKQRQESARAAAAAGKVDLRLAIVKLAEAVLILRVTLGSGQQSAELMAEVDQCIDEAIDLAGGKEDEPDAPTDDSSSRGSGPSGE
jgi:hypothetical protein